VIEVRSSCSEPEPDPVPAVEPLEVARGKESARECTVEEEEPWACNDPESLGT
jgi:hypothetical protein